MKKKNRITGENTNFYKIKTHWKSLAFFFFNVRLVKPILNESILNLNYHFQNCCQKMLLATNNLLLKLIG